MAGSSQQAMCLNAKGLLRYWGKQNLTLFWSASRIKITRVSRSRTRLEFKVKVKYSNFRSKVVIECLSSDFSPSLYIVFIRPFYLSRAFPCKDEYPDEIIKYISYLTGLPSPLIPF